MKAVEGAFNKERSALVGALSRYCETLQSPLDSSSDQWSVVMQNGREQVSMVSYFSVHHGNCECSRQLWPDNKCSHCTVSYGSCTSLPPPTTNTNVHCTPVLIDLGIQHLLKISPNGLSKCFKLSTEQQVEHLRFNFPQKVAKYPHLTLTRARGLSRTQDGECWRMK